MVETQIGGMGGNFLGLYSFTIDAYWAKFIGSSTKVNKLHIGVGFQDKILDWIWNHWRSNFTSSTTFCFLTFILHSNYLPTLHNSSFHMILFQTLNGRAMGNEMLVSCCPSNSIKTFHFLKVLIQLIIIFLKTTL